MTNISAPAISRILSGANIKKALRGDSWSPGFEVFTLHGFVEVAYTAGRDEDKCERLAAIVEVINSRKDQKYFAEIFDQGGFFVSHGVKVTYREEIKMTEKVIVTPVVTESEVLAVMNKGRRYYPFEESGSGFVVERAAAPNDHLVRVTYRDSSHTTYAPETGGRDAYSHAIVTRYAELLMEAGYSVCMDFQGNEDSVLVGHPGEFGKSQQDTAKDAKEALAELREAVEDDDLAYMTRKAGPTSIFVYYLVPFKDKVRRLEVFWSEGVYQATRRLGGPKDEFFNMAHLLEHIRHELAD